MNASSVCSVRILFRGHALKLADESGDPVTRIRPRALMVPPGFPDTMSRIRVVATGQVLLAGRAWSGHGQIARVEVSTDAGVSWNDSDLGPSQGRWACGPVFSLGGNQSGSNRAMVQGNG